MHDSHTQGRTKGRGVAAAIAVALAFAGLYLTSYYNYLLYHSLAEIFSAVTACGIFMIAWNSRHFLQNGCLLVLGIACFFVAVLDLTHMLAYKGMPIFQWEKGANTATQLWIAARYLESVSLLAGMILLRRQLSPVGILLTCGVVTAALLASILGWRVFPTCYVDGAGLTAFKRVSEYVICLVLGLAMFLLWRKREAFDPEVRVWLAWFLGFTIVSELAFTFYVGVYDVANFLGHFLKIVAFYCLYRAIIETGFSRPYALLLRELKESEAALRKAKQRLELAQRVGNIGTFEWNADSREAIWTEGMEKLYGVPPGGLGGTLEDWRRRIHPEDLVQVDHAVADALAGRAPYNADFRVIWPDGSTHWVRACGELQRDAANQPVQMTGLNIDITARKTLELELERLVSERTAKLHEMVAELEHFSYSLTHDMRAPLRAMRGFAEVVNGLFAPNARQEEKEFLRRIIMAADRMDLLITDALNYNRAVRQELALSPVNLPALLEGMLQTYPEFQQDRAHIMVEDGLPWVLANEAALTQCFSNLLGNAVKFVRPGEKPQIRVWSEARDGWCRIWVEDQGVGISPEMLPRMFQMFTRGHKEYEGTGIGLALVRKVVQRMGGRVGVESEVGKGSRFWVEFRPADPVSS